MKQVVLIWIIALSMPCMVFAKNKVTATAEIEIPVEVSQWIDGELAKAKRKTLMDFEAGEFFESDTARLIGYIKDYDPVTAGFTTGMIFAKNEITRESFPIIVQIHEDGRFESSIPMNYPIYSVVAFNTLINFYIQPGQTLAMLLDWEDLQMAEEDMFYRFKNIVYQGTTGDINNELYAFSSLLPNFPYEKIQNEMMDKNPNEVKSFYDELLLEYTHTYQRLLETEKLSEASKTTLRNDYLITYSTSLLEYAINYPNQLPLEFYDFLQNIPMDNEELLSTHRFSTVINRLEFCRPFRDVIKIIRNKISSKTYFQYLFEELNLPKTSEDEAIFLMMDSIVMKLNSPDATEGEKEKLMEEYHKVFEKFSERYKQYEESYEKYLNNIPQLSQLEITAEEWSAKDSIYTNVLKLKQGIVYDVMKIRSLDFMFGDVLNNDKEAAWKLLTTLTSDIPESFLRKEADRLFQKNFPEEERGSYELPDTYEAKIFKKLIALFKGKVVLVDFWSTSCGPCISNIKHHKALREEYKNSPDAAFVFITSENESPSLERYEKFVEEQGLTNSYRINADEYRYLRQLFRFNGIPRYVLVDREGRILNDDLSSHLHEEKLKKAIKM